MDVNPLYKARELLQRVRGIKLEEIARQEKAVALAKLLVEAAREEQTHSEFQQQQLFSRLMEDTKGRLFTTDLADQCFRSQDPARIADQLRYLLQVWGVPHYLSLWERGLFHTFQMAGSLFPRWSIPFLQKQIRRQVDKVIVSAEEPTFTDYLQSRHSSGVRVNLNYLGEAILGEREAEERLNQYIEALRRHDVDYVSVKISTLSSQINTLAWEETIERLAIPLRKLYAAVQTHLYQNADDTLHPKFVNLDMEEYRDLLLTVRLFQKVLSEKDFHSCHAGLVLQSYLPEAYTLQRELTEWAERRCKEGGAPIKLRLVKGANLEMEKVDASLHGWSLAPYGAKWETDANYKRMLLFAMDPNRAPNVNIGIGSHNLLDVAYALILRAERRLEEYVSFEMLEGMAPHIQRVVQGISGSILVYSPAARDDQFYTAIAYLIRRLDENTAPGNFLRSCFSMEVDSLEWQHQVEQFLSSCEKSEDVPATPHRQQDREKLKAPPLDALFANEPDTDWSLPQSREWLLPYLEKQKETPLEEIPLVVEGEMVTDRAKAFGSDPSRPDRHLYTYQLGTSEDAKRAAKCAAKNAAAWGSLTASERSERLAAVAQEIRKERGSLIAALVADGGKTVSEADTEISEAIDFCEYYRRNIEEVAALQDITWKPLGVILLAPPWNFALSLSVGGIAAALAAGNAVIYKPPLETILVGWKIVQLFWRSGISKEALQFITGEDETVGTTLVQDPNIAAVILTGATSTAEHLLRLRPGLRLFAETGGKNSIIVSPMADRDLAVRSLVQSAFGYAGQKCSACSLAICLAEVYDDPRFREQLLDAATSMPVGSAWDLTTVVPPLIHKAHGDLLAALNSDSIEWLLKPKQDPQNPGLWSPGIALGVTRESLFYKKELFGPILSVMRATDMQEAIELANGTPYGLTAGLHTLDRREQRYWLKRITAGNCYINRNITGAIVQRQPFGGCKASSFGTGAKAGGPNYVLQLMQPSQSALPYPRQEQPSRLHELSAHVVASPLASEERELWQASLGSYVFFWQRYFSQDHDPSRIVGEDNLLRFRPKEGAILRLQVQDSPLDILRAIAAALVVRCPLEISSPPLSHPLLQGSWRSHLGTIHFVEETPEELSERLQGRYITSIRSLSPLTPDAIKALTSFAIVTSPVLANGRLELLHYLREVTISYSYHRYGYLGNREKTYYPSDDTPAGCCFGPAAPEGCCGKGECDQM